MVMKWDMIGWVAMGALVALIVVVALQVGA